METKKAETAGAFDIADLIRMLRNNFKLIAIVVVVVVGVNLIFNFFIADRTYAAQATLVTTSTQEAGGVLSTLSQLGDVGSNIITPTLGISSDAQLCGHILRSKSARRKLVAEYSIQEILDVEDEQKAVEKLENYIDITVDLPNIVEIRTKLPAGPLAVPRAENDRIRQMVSEIVQSQIDTLRAILNEFQLSSAKRRRVFLEKKKSEVERQLHDAELALAQWQADNEMIAVDEVTELMSKQLIDLHSGIVEARIAQKALDEQIKETTRLAKMEPDTVIASRQRVADPAIKQLRDRMVEMEQELATARFVERKTENHPDVQRLQVELEASRKELAQAERKKLQISQETQQANPVKEAIAEKLAVLRVNREAEQARVAGYERALKAAQGRISGLSNKQLEYGQLLRELKVRESLYEEMVQQYETALISEQAEEPNFHILDSPVVPYTYATPKPLPSAAISLFFAILVAIIVVWLRGPQRPEEVEGGEEEHAGSTK